SEGEDSVMKRLLIVVASLLAASGAPSLAQQPDGRVLVFSCLNCHGPGGKSPGEIPSLAGKNELFLKTAMLDFRDGKRSSTVMSRLAKGYSDAEIDALAQYIATLK